MAQSWVARHWRGELSLAVSFWINNLLLPIPLGLGIGALGVWITLTGDGLRSGAIALLVAWPLLLLLSSWCVVGCWRAARAYRASGGGVLWSGGAQLLLALSALATLASFGLEFLPRAGEYLRMARGIDPLGHLEARVSPDGRRLSLSGPIGLGDAQRVQAMLAQARRVRTVELQSPGGRLLEAERLAAALRAAGLDTRTVGDCQSACTLLHMAGQRRQMLPQARLGFHRASTGTVNPVLDQFANRELARAYRGAGLPEPMLRRVLQTPAHAMWHPGRDELVAAGLITVSERPLDVELPGDGAPLAAAEVETALRANDTWLALEGRFPGLVQAAAGRLLAAQAGGASVDEQQVQAQRVIEPRIGELLAAESPWPREAYLGLLIDQLEAARSGGQPALCPALLAGDAAARRRLAPALAQREAAWLLGAAQEPARSAPVRPFNPLESEIIQRRLGEGAPARLRGLWRAAASPGAAADARGGPGCERALEWLRAVAALPPMERRLANRLLFEGG